MQDYQYAVTIPSMPHPKVVEFKSGQVCLVVGPNGVGKSALLHQLFRNIGQSLSDYYPGHRSITFSHGHENLSMNIADLDKQFWTNTESFNRYRNHWPEEQFKSVIRKIQHAQAAHNEKIIKRIRDGEDGTILAQLNDSPIAKINHCFHIAGLPIVFDLDIDGFTARRSDNRYSIDRLSDGERAALFIVGAIVTTFPGRVLMIDEPERHLHPSISAPLISTAIRLRPEISYCFATHDLNLIQNIEAEQILFVKNSNVLSVQPEQRHYEVHFIRDVSEVSDDLKKDILGVRDKVLFVEGEATSLDRALYTAAFPDWKISPRGGADKVIEATAALASNLDLHWIQAAGLVDGDGRDEVEKSKLKLKNIMTLPCPSIENLFFLPGVVRAICELMSETDNISVEQRIAHVNSEIRILLNENKDEIIYRRTAWSVNREISESKISIDKIRNGVDFNISINANAHYNRISEELNEFIAGPYGINELKCLPIKATKIPSKITNLLGCSSLKWYKTAVLRQIELNSPRGIAMIEEIRSILPVIE